MNLYEAKPIIYTAQSRALFYCRMLICKYAIGCGVVPINPLNLWGYFLNDLVDRDLIRQANNNVLRIVDEIWTFGPIANGVWAEIEYGMELGKPIKFFSAGTTHDAFRPLSPADLTFEPE